MVELCDLIEKEDFEEVEKKIKGLGRIDLQAQKFILSQSRSKKMTKLLEDYFKVSNSEDSLSDSSEPNNDNLKEKSDSHFECELSEAEAIKKHSNNDKKLEKAACLFLASFKANIKNINNDKAAFLSFEIAKLILDKAKESFPKMVRTKSHNLKENSKLCQQVYDKTSSVAEFVEMSISEMKSEKLKDEDEIAIKNSILSAQVAKPAAETDIFECSKCKQKKCTYSQLQTRSCDEPMTTFVYCTVCGNRWKF